MHSLNTCPVRYKEKHMTESTRELSFPLLSVVDEDSISAIR